MQENECRTIDYNFRKFFNPSIFGNCICSFVGSEGPVWQEIYTLEDRFITFRYNNHHILQ